MKVDNSLTMEITERLTGATEKTTIIDIHLSIPISICKLSRRIAGIKCTVVNYAAFSK